ncbi:MAG: PQQ-binding-like beta-propeller repeat protein [Gemmatimonadetes bacterium]|nr:PQQ-binding-like beta-propeller repeat protein [Gemmatimonadota bacterium]
MAAPSVARFRSSSRAALIVAGTLGLGACLTGDNKSTSPALTLPTPLWTYAIPRAAAGPLFTEASGVLLMAVADSVFGINAVAGAQPAGSVRWSRGIGPLPLGGTQFGVAPNNATFSGSTLQVVDLATGTTSYTDPLGASSSLASGDGTSIFVARTSPAYRVDAISSTGASGWSAPLATACPTGCTFTGTAVSGDTVYVAGTQVGGAAKPVVVALNRLTGAEFWRYIDTAVDSTITQPPVVSGAQLVLVGTAGRIVWALNRSTRSVSWSRDETGTPVTVRPVAATGNTIIMSQFFLEAVAADAGTTSWSAQSSTGLQKVVACGSSVAVSTPTDVYVLAGVTGTLGSGREGISMTSGTGDILGTPTRLYVTTTTGGTLLNNATTGAVLAAYACP